MKIERKAKFILHKRKADETKNLLLRFRISMRGQKPIDIMTGKHIDLCDWDETQQRALGNSAEAKSINLLIAKWTNLIEDIFSRYELIEQRTPKPEEVKDLFNDYIGRPTALTRILDSDGKVLTVFDKFTASVGIQNEWTASTYEKFATVRKHLEEFDPELMMSDVDTYTMEKYLAHLHKLKLANTTIAKNLSFVRWFFRWAATNGIYKGNIHETFKPRLKGTSVDSREIIYLTQEEIKKLQEHQFTAKEEALERVCDVFLFCCFTGLRYSDAAKLKRTDVKNGYVSVVTKKTVDALKIELNRHSKAILDKYRDKKFPGGLALPVISNEKMNEHLKVLGQVCGLDDPTRIVYFKGATRYEEVYPKWALLTTHCARRTFVVTALQLGIPAEVVMKWTGHANFQTMKPYIAIVDTLKEKSMALFDGI